MTITDSRLAHIETCYRNGDDGYHAAIVPELIAAIRELQAQLNAKPQRSRSKKQRVEDELRASDLTAQTAGRQDIEYGHHDTLPRGEHVARVKS